MDHRTRNLFAVLMVVIVAVTAGAALLLSDTTMPASEGPAEGSPEGSPLGSPLGSPEIATVEGVVIAVDSAGLDDVRGFTLRTVGGETLEFQLGELENGAEFPPAHLAVHQVDAYPVRVSYRMEGEERYAVRLEDGEP
jgi:hypothetical protein